jgi:hypothetical protein
MSATFFLIVTVTVLMLGFIFTASFNDDKTSGL